MSTAEVIGMALLAVVQVLTLVLHQALSARRHKRTLSQVRQDVTSLRPVYLDVVRGSPLPDDERNPLQLCLSCYHTARDHADAGPRIGGACNICDCAAFRGTDER